MNRKKFHSYFELPKKQLIDTAPRVSEVKTIHLNSKLGQLILSKLPPSFWVNTEIIAYNNKRYIGICSQNII